MAATIILVHGRGEQFQDPVTLETAWENALFKGLAAAGVVHPPPRERILFPYYADLYQIYSVGLRQAVTVKEKHERIAFEREITSLIRRKLARKKKRPLPRRRDSPSSLWFIDPALELMDRVPGFSRGFIRLVFRDIHDYLANKGGLRDRTMGRVFEPIKKSGSGKTIIVAYSMGTIVTYDILNTHSEIEVDLLITIGSPLGIDEAIRNRLLPDSACRRGVPTGVKKWVNFADPDDFVALDERLADDFKKNGAVIIRDVRVRNPRGANRTPHDSDSYLSQKLLGVEIARALGMNMKSSGRSGPCLLT